MNVMGLSAGSAPNAVESPSYYGSVYLEEQRKKEEAEKAARAKQPAPTYADPQGTANSVAKVWGNNSPLLAVGKLPASTLQTGMPHPQAGIAAPQQNQPAAPVNHDFINQLNAQAAGGTSAADIASQKTATSSENMLRLQAGANTLGGDYAAQGAAAQGLDATEDQNRSAYAQASHEAAKLQANGQLTSALGQEVEQAGSWSRETLNQNVTDTQDMLNEINTRAQGASAEQRSRIQQASNNLQNLMNEYKVAREQDRADASSLLGKIKAAMGVLTVAAGAVLTAIPGGAVAGIPLIAGGASLASGGLAAQ